MRNNACSTTNEQTKDEIRKISDVADDAMMALYDLGHVAFLLDHCLHNAQDFTRGEEPKFNHELQMGAAAILRWQREYAVKIADALSEVL